MSTMPDTRGYLAALIACLLGPLLVIAATNIFVDPLNWRWPRSSLHLPAQFELFDREAHYNLAIHTKPRTLLIGNSQTQLGLVPSHWRDAPQPVINAAVFGGEIDEMRRVLIAAERNRHVDLAVLGLDFGMARGRVGLPTATNENALVSSDGGLRPQMIRVVMSMAMLKASLASLNQRLRRNTSDFGDDGEALATLYFRTTAEHGGSRVAMGGRLTQVQRNFRQPPGDLPTQLRALRNTACDSHTRLIVYLTPLHVIWIEELSSLGLGPAWEGWKREIVRISTERPGCGFDVWDFNTFNPVTTEHVPPAGKGIFLQNTWDGVHFTPRVGDRIMARLLGKSNEQADGFGVRLSATTIDSALAEDRARRNRYFQEQPQEPKPEQILREYAMRSRAQ